MNRTVLLFGLLVVMFAVAVVVTWMAFTTGEDAAREDPSQDPVPAVERQTPGESDEGEEGEGIRAE